MYDEVASQLRDVFVPGYHCSPHYVDVVNVTNTRVIKVTEVRNVYNTVVINHVTNVNYTYVNNVHAVTAVSRDTFVNARPVARAFRCSPTPRCRTSSETGRPFPSRGRQHR